MDKARNDLLLLFVITLALTAYQSQADDKKGDKSQHVIIWDLDEVEFNKSVKNTDFLVMCFYAKKSRASAEFNETYSDVAQKIFKENKNIEFGQIDIGKHREVDMHSFVSEIPMLRFYKRGRYYDFKGQKTVKHITTWIHLAMNVPLLMSSRQELDDLKQRSTVIVGCFVGNAPEDAYKTFLNVSARFVSAELLPLPRFALITKASVSRDVGMIKGTIAIFKDFERGEKAVYEGPLTNSEQLLKFCEEEAQPVVFPYGANNYSHRTSSTRVKYQHLLFMDPSESKFKQTLVNFKAAAKAFMKNLNDIQVLFIHVDTSHKDIDKVVSFFHVDMKKDLPCNRITKKDEFHSRFIPAKLDFTKEGFIDFTKDVVNGKIKRNIRSEKVPGDWDKYPVKVLVGSMYEEMTQAKGKTVFVMYYIPDDKKCDEMKSIVDEVAMKYRLNDTVVVATMDVSKNDGEIDVHHTFPSFKLFTAENHVKTYIGAPTATIIQAFIDSNGATQMGVIKSLHENVGSFYDFENFDQTSDNPESLDYEGEEEREIKWTMEEMKMIENAVTETEGHKADEDEKHIVNFGHHKMTEEGYITDHKDMDPKEHAHYGIHHPHDTGEYEFQYKEHHANYSHVRHDDKEFQEMVKNASQKAKHDEQ